MIANFLSEKEAENGIDEENVSRKITNLFQALKSATQHLTPAEEFHGGSNE